MNKIFLLLGGNMGDRYDLLNRAKQNIIENIGEIAEESSIYETAPWGFSAEKNFLNQLVIVLSMLSPMDVLTKCLESEDKLGRERLSDSYSSRTMDIDILFYNMEVIDELNLIIPHRHLHKRRFVLEPLVELAPDFIHPVLNKTVVELLRNCEDTTEVRIL